MSFKFSYKHITDTDSFYDSGPDLDAKPLYLKLEEDSVQQRTSDERSLHPAAPPMCSPEYYLLSNHSATYLVLYITNAADSHRPSTPRILTSLYWVFFVVLTVPPLISGAYPRRDIKGIYSHQEASVISTGVLAGFAA